MMPSPRRALAVGSLPVRSLVLLASVVVLLIAGLLGMHVLGGSGGGHGAGHGTASFGAAPFGAPTVQTAPIGPTVEHARGDATGSHAHATHAAPAAKAIPCDGECADPAPLPPGQAELMACVLALLAGLLVLVPPGSLGRSWLPVATLPARLDASAVLLVPPPPSLTLLSISRT